MLRFTKGDIVIIKPDIKEGECWIKLINSDDIDRGYVNEAMVRLAGKTAEIVDVLPNAYVPLYKINLDRKRWDWYDHLFNPGINITIDGFDKFMSDFYNK